MNAFFFRLLMLLALSKLHVYICLFTQLMLRYSIFFSDSEKKSEEKRSKLRYYERAHLGESCRDSLGNTISQV